MGVDIAETAIAQTTATWNPGWVEFNISSHVQDIAAGAANYGWRDGARHGQQQREALPQQRSHGHNAPAQARNPVPHTHRRHRHGLLRGGQQRSQPHAVLPLLRPGHHGQPDQCGGDIQISLPVDPFGAITEQQGASVNRQVFTGQEHDEQTGLIYFGARFYDPDIGRFLNQDTYLGEPGTPPSLHRYLYAYGNPTVYVDLYGNEPVDAANSFVSGLVNLVRGGDIGLRLLRHTRRFKEYARNASFGSWPHTKSYSVDFTGHSETISYRTNLRRRNRLRLDIWAG